MLWFGDNRLWYLYHERKFKNILCYGSASCSNTSFFFINTFKNILCYGSAQGRKCIA